MTKRIERKMYLAVGIIVGIQLVGVVCILIFNAVHERRYHRDLLADKTLTLQFVGPETVELQDLHAFRRGDELAVSGCLNRPAAAGPAVSQIDVALLSVQGALLHQAVIQKFSRCKRGGEHFNIRFPTIPADGSVLSLRAFAERGEGPKLDSSSPGPGN